MSTSWAFSAAHKAAQDTALDAAQTPPWPVAKWVAVGTGSELPAVQPPDAVYTRQRYVRRDRVEWVQACDEIMVKHGLVVGALTYPTKERARYPARNLKRLMVELRLHEAWQLREHVERVGGGWGWSVEYLGRSQ